MDEFTQEELNMLASFVCERVDSLEGVLDDPKVTNESFKQGSRKAIKDLATLDVKLRPFYIKGKYN